MIAELVAEQWTSAVDRVVTEVLSTAGVDAPPVDALAVAAELGIVVAVDERQNGRARLVRLQSAAHGPSRGSILLRPEPRAERRQWAVAHEIGEECSQRVFAELGLEPCEIDSAAREAAANQFAGRLLVPTPWFALHAPSCDWHLPTLKQLYGTASHELIARRMLDLPTLAIITIFDHGRLRFRRGNLPGRALPLSPREIACWQQSHASGRSTKRRHVNAAEHIAALQCWPIHEPDWKREILRTEVKVDDEC